MTRNVRAFGSVAVLALLAACSSPAPAPAQQVKYDWAPQSRVAKVQFDANNRSCTADARRVSDYEQCMAGKGYTLVER